MKVTVEYNHYVLRKITGKEAEHLQVGDASSFQDLLALLENRYGKAFTDLERIDPFPDPGERGRSFGSATAAPERGQDTHSRPDDQRVGTSTRAVGRDPQLFNTKQEEL